MSEIEMDPKRNFYIYFFFVSSIFLKFVQPNQWQVHGRRKV